ncbi:hypothetical protein SL003B_0228 [Polymorphum gilvum SL003B-26A1]|uniref:Uncharacterized protein n=1 Tax=Polymorphum gilvum (strain LMG 25793 / CGMCC 1.9160 / SL003B-26A1) TaxID=991905 RepID=F2J0D2_POLGS|nr:hypothetical protein SL003B_0228 [Polymorphum gilvum SL003B-26A1]
MHDGRRIIRPPACLPSRTTRRHSGQAEREPEPESRGVDGVNEGDRQDPGSSIPHLRFAACGMMRFEGCQQSEGAAWAHSCILFRAVDQNA